MQTHAPVGVDIASKKFDVAVWKGDTSYKTRVFPNAPKGFIALKNSAIAISAWKRPARTASRWLPSRTMKAMASALKTQPISSALARPSRTAIRRIRTVRA